MEGLNKKLHCILLLTIGIYFFVLPVVARQVYPDWQIGYHEAEIDQPDQWYVSTVPGAVQLDLMRGDEQYKQPWWYSNNVQQFEWMEDVWFTYRTTFSIPELEKGERLYFFSKGIDYQFKIILNGQILLEQEGMFTHVNVDLTDALQDSNELRVVIYPVPKLGFDDPVDNPDNHRRNARESVKPAVSYRWDWHPRCITRGIWDETYLVVRPRERLNDLFISYTLSDEMTEASIKVDVEGEHLSGKDYRWKLMDPRGEVVIDKHGELQADHVIIESELVSPLLWWPNGYGDPNLYSSEFVLYNIDGVELERFTSRTGFRRVQLILNEKSWNDTWGFPATSALPPASLEVNGQRIFAKGSNWVHPEVFVGTITSERYREQLVLAKNAHFNLLRVWGGGIVNKESFYDICDELGLLVWQEFPLACNVYPDKPSYLRVLEQEAISIVKRLRKHASIALWSGGNELYWAGMTEQSLPFRLLNSICYHLDPQTPFINTSPFYGVGHGHYLFYDKNRDEEVFQWMIRATNTAYTEFAVPGASNIEVLKSFIPSEDLFPPKPTEAWRTHHGFGAWQTDSWLEIPTLEKYFGGIKTLEELVAYSQMLQCEGLKFIYEEARRQKPYCSMALNWCYQEPWPTAANNSLINWPNEIKPAYWHVANACRPVLASARIPKFEWQAGEDFTCDLFMLNDTYNELENSRVEVTMQYDGKEEVLLTWDCPATGEARNVKGPTLHAKIPEMETNLFTIRVKVEGKPQYNSAYVLLFKGDDVVKSLPPRAYYQGETNFILQ